MRRSATATLLEKLALEMGASVVMQPDVYTPGGYITFKNGRRRFFHSNQLGINQYGPAMVARNKHCAAFLLEIAGYSTPEGRIFLFEQMRDQQARYLADAWNYAQTLTLPAIIKPNDFTHGRLVAKVHTFEEFEEITAKIIDVRADMLVQRFYSGNDFRIVVLDDEVIVAYQRTPPTIIGDGHTSIATLINDYQHGLDAQGRDVHIDASDLRIQHNLQRAQLGMESILAQGEHCILLNTTNMSAGAQAIDCTQLLHASYKSLCCALCRALGLRLGGIDLIAGDLTQPDGAVVVLEVNATPGLKHFATLGEAQAVLVEGFYRRILTILELEKLA